MKKRNGKGIKEERRRRKRRRNVFNGVRRSWSVFSTKSERQDFEEDVEEKFVTFTIGKKTRKKSTDFTKKNNGGGGQIQASRMYCPPFSSSRRKFSASCCEQCRSPRTRATNCWWVSFTIPSMLPQTKRVARLDAIIS